MDQLDTPSAGSLGPPPGEGRGPGRPAIGAAQRAINDEKYAKMQELLDALPEDAKEYRLSIYPARRTGKSKADLHALESILLSKYNESGFKDRQAFAEYLEDKFGSGRYLIEWLDEHDQRLIKIPTYVINAGEDMEGDFEDDDRGGWNRRRRSRRDDAYDDDEDEDPRERRANVADMLSTTARAQSSQVTAVAKQSGDMMTMLLMTQQSAAETRAAEERRRDDARVEERRREEQRAEDRRREMELERKERESREERRREEDRRERERDEQRRRDEQLAAMQASNKRTEIMIGAVTALVPVLAKVMEKKEDTTLPLLLKLSEKKDDPITLMLLKSIVDKSNDDSATKTLFTSMGEMQKLTSQMTAEQMRSMMQLSNDMNGTIMKKAMDMMMSSPQGQTPEGKSMIEQVMGAVQGAAEIVKALVPSQPAIAAPVQAARLGHRAAPVADQPAAPGAPATPAAATPAPGEPARELTEAEKQWAAMTPAQQEAARAAQPRGVEGVLYALKAIQTKQYANQSEYQGLIQFLVSEMPLELRVAVLDADQVSVLAICNPFVQAKADLSAWVMQSGVLEAIQTFVSQLPPSLEAVYGKADDQRAQLVAARAAAAEGAKPAEVAATEPAATAEPSPTGEASPIPGPGFQPPVPQDTLPEGPPVPLPDSSPSGSHLDGDKDDP
jgi:hypothetical protein